MNNAQELNFGYKVRHALNEQLDDLPTSTVDRLASARKMALARKKSESPLRVLVRQRALAGEAGSMSNERFSWPMRLSLIIPLLVLVLGLIGIVQYEKQVRIDETADIDAAMLSDELPTTAYADTGFNAYLEKRAE